VSAISGFCEKCNGFRKRYCDGDRNTCMSILFDTIESLQLENERFKVQASVIKETFEYEANKHREMLHKYASNPEARGRAEGFLEAVSIYKQLIVSEQDYHNPADVEVLRKAREAIQQAYDNYELIGEYEYDISSYLEEALAEIDKTISRRINS
jgi:hypothetical protein